MEGFLDPHKKQLPMEAVAIRRAKLNDRDIVRYRVYSNPTEFVAVIAENALMAVKVSAVKNPYKIMRDFPTDGVAIAAQRMAQMEDVPERITLPMVARVSDKLKLEGENSAKQRVADPFVAMGLADLQNKGRPRARILPPDLLSEIIEQHHKVAEPVAVSTPMAEPVRMGEPMRTNEPAPPPPTFVPEPEPVQVSQEEQIISAPIAQSVEQRIAQLADEVLPPASAAIPAPATPPREDPLLSEEEVEKLLNGDA